MNYIKISFNLLCKELWTAMCVSLWLAGKEEFINLPMCANNLDLYLKKKKISL